MADRYDASDAPELVEPLERHRIDTDRLAEWLADYVPEAKRGLTVHQFQGGMSNPTYLVTVEGGARFVIRKKPPGELLPKAHQIDREHRVMDALKGSGVPVPQMIALCQDADVIGADFFVMSFVDGRIIKPPTLDPIAVADRRDLYFDLIDVLAALHLVDHVEVGLERFGRPDAYLSRQTARWADQYARAKPALPDSVDYTDFDWLRDWLLERAGEYEATSIVHGDFRPGNTITHPNAPRCLAVLDWELATIGHPLSDLAYFCLPYRQPNQELGGFVGIDRQAMGLPAEEELLERYAEKTGRDGIPDWPVYMAFSFFRIAAIVQGVAARAALGNVSSASANAERDVARATLMARIGAGIAREADPRREV